MPTLPLYTVPAHPDACHGVTAPGGYERWHFDAEDPAGRVRVVAVFGLGCDSRTDYLRRYARYRRRPTSHRPPVPAEYPYVSLAVYKDDRLLGRWTARPLPDEFSASAERVEVRIGPNALDRESDGTFRLHLTGRRLSADLVFRPRWDRLPCERSLPSGQQPAVAHRWVIADPLCGVEGVVRVGGADSPASVAREIPFAGRGYHDHHYGTAPPGLGLRWRIRGRLLGGDGALAFHVARPHDAGATDDVLLVTADAAGVREGGATCAVDWGGGMFTASFPARMTFDGGLTFTSPRVIDRKGRGVRVLYDGRGERLSGTAFCEIERPQPPRGRVFGRVIGWASRLCSGG